MKYCPHCENEGWEPEDGFTKPVINKGKDNHKNFAIRYYICINCNYRWKSIEKFYEEVKPASAPLFDDEG